ncbi:xanthine dehydrogenase family protein subunit M, partial [bacterium]
SITAAAAAAAAQAEPTADTRGAVDYKRDMVRVLTSRALHAARATIQA